MFICEAAGSSRLPHPPPTHFPVSSPTESSAFNTAASRFIAQAQWISPFSGDNKTHHWKRCSNYLWLAIIRPPLEQLHPRTKSLQTKTQSAIKTVNVKERKGGLWNYSLIPADWSNLQQQQICCTQGEQSIGLACSLACHSSWFTTEILAIESSAIAVRSYRFLHLNISEFCAYRIYCGLYKILVRRNSNYFSKQPESFTGMDTQCVSCEV